jgi:hypothetical protein
MFAQECKQLKDTQQRNIDVQVNCEILLDSGRYTDEAREE